MEKIKYPKIKNAVLLCLLVIGIQLISGFIFGVVIALLGYTTESLFYGISIIIAQVLSFVTAIFIGWKKSKVSFKDIFKFKNISFEIWIYMIFLTLGFIILSSEIDNLLNFLLPMPIIFIDTFNELFINQNFFIALILIAIIPAFTEEMLFRGLFITGFRKNYSIQKTIIVSAFLFGFIHLNPWQFVGAFIIGIFSGWLFIKTESILLSVYLHFFNNTLYFLTIKFSNFIPIKGFNSNFSLPVNFQPWWFDLIGIIITITGFIFLNQAIKKEYKKQILENTIQNI